MNLRILPLCHFRLSSFLFLLLDQVIQRGSLQGAYPRDVRNLHHACPSEGPQTRRDQNCLHIGCENYKGNEKYIFLLVT